MKMPKRIDLLVVEDDEATCLEYEQVCKQYEDVFLIGTSAHAKEALKITEEFKPNAVVLDLELQKGSGNGIDYLTHFDDYMLKVKPFILVVTNNVSQITQSIVRNAGADFIIVKSQADYSVEMVVNFLRSIEMICHKEQTYICNEVAKKYGKTSASVERAMQNAIDHAWKTTDTTTLETHYTAYISPKKGNPTITEFIYYYADKAKNSMS